MVSDSGLGLWGPVGVVSRCGLRGLKKIHLSIKIGRDGVVGIAKPDSEDGSMAGLAP